MTMRGLILFCAAFCAASSAFGATAEAAAPFPAEQVAAGGARFIADCGFCHGRDAQGGSRGLDLTRSELVAADTGGAAIGEVVTRGRVDKGMPAFPALSAADIAGIAAYIKVQKQIAERAEGGRRSVEPADLLAGDATRGRAYFAANCSQCHAADGDLAGVASRLVGLQLVMKMLNPRSGQVPAKPRAQPVLHVTEANGASFSGTLAHRDEFSVALRDADGVYRSWRTDAVTWRVEDPLDAHIAQLPRYTDADMHDVLAFLMTLEAGAAQ
jgi:cytochrome c oxidase cbb3-type subunit 3